MSIFALIGIGLVTGLTTVLFGFGGGFVTVPAVTWADAGAGPDAARVAVATSAVVMVVNAGIATAASDRGILRLLRRSGALPAALAVGGAAGALAANWTPRLVTEWGFVAYLAVTIVDLVVRPGFLRTGASGRVAGRESSEVAIPAALGLPIGALAAFLGVGGSVMTVPLLRRSGCGMRAAVTLANQLTFALAAPALGVFLGEPTHAGAAASGLGYGSVDLGAAAALLAGALPVIVILRRRPLRIPDVLHARSYPALLVIVLAVMIVATARTM